MHVVAGEVAGDADQARSAPQNLGRGRRPEPDVDQVLELRPVVHQPGQVEQALIDHAGIRAALVLDDDRRAVLVQPERVDPASVHRAGAVLACQEPDAEQRLHVYLDEILHLGLDPGKTRNDLSHAASRRIRAEQLQARHLPLLSSEITNADEVRDCFRERLRGREDSVRLLVRPDRGRSRPPVTGNPRFLHVSPATWGTSPGSCVYAGQPRSSVVRARAF